ncbi:MAG: discoidin domain-containing protein [Deltaproteobacteria bacterium]
MTNLALHKPVEEEIGNASAATDGEVSHYTLREGYASFGWPGTLTIDLGEPQMLCCIRILLWDGLGEGGTIRDSRIYSYRLLASVDHNNWRVLFDTGRNGSNGWQVFNFQGGFETRYIRLHGLTNSINKEFHIVQVEAHDEDPHPLAVEVILQRIIETDPLQVEAGDGLPLQSKVRSIINEIDHLVETSQFLNPQPFKELISQLRVQLTDVSSIERSMDSIRREIIGPVKTELDKTAKLGKYSLWGFIVGIIGGILAISSIVFSIYVNASTSTLHNRLEEIIETLADIKSNNIGFLNRNLGIGNVDTTPFHETKDLKQGDVFESFITGASLIVNKINQDNTANITTNIPLETEGLNLTLRGWGNSEMKYFENVSTGTSWQFKHFSAEYNMSVTSINFSKGLVTLEVKEVGRKSLLPSSTK